MEMNEKIKMLRQNLGLTLENIGDIVGVGKSTVRKWENGDIANMKRDKIAKLAAALKTTPSYLMGWDDKDVLYAKEMAPMLKEQHIKNYSTDGYSPEENIKTLQALAFYAGKDVDDLFTQDTKIEINGVMIPLDTTKVPFKEVNNEKKVPILGRIAAGTPILAVENIERYENVENDKIDYALIVKGDSMIGARIYEGDTVYVQQDVGYENGDIVIALINGDDATVKRLYRYADEIILKPENPTMKEFHYKPEEVSLLGKVVEVKFKL